jgi:hypothetical protein
MHRGCCCCHLVACIGAAVAAIYLHALGLLLLPSSCMHRGCSCREQSAQTKELINYMRDNDRDQRQHEKEREEARMQHAKEMEMLRHRRYEQ